MLIEGKFTLDAPIQEVWGLLFEIDTLAACIPGAEKLEEVGENTYDAVVKQKVGPIAVRLKFTTTLTEIDPPRHVTAEGRGGDMGKAGTFTQRSTLDLTEISKDTVEVAYSSNVSLVGRLSTFGERIMRAKTKQLQQEITTNLQAALKKRLAGQDKSAEA
jgi:carbon monoxide dehydrogenase subunit G